jgi:hypothetical protein
MQFEFLDRYLLDGEPAKAQVVKQLLQAPAGVPGAAPFYEGMRMLGPKTPDLTLIALRLVLAGKAAEDGRVIALRQIVERARAKGIDRESAVADYHRQLS